MSTPCEDMKTSLIMARNVCNLNSRDEVDVVLRSRNATDFACEYRSPELDATHTYWQ